MIIPRQKGQFQKGQHASPLTEFQKGKPSFRKGKKFGTLGVLYTRKPLSNEHKQKIREANLGKKASEETRQKISNSHKGKAKPNAFRNLGTYSIKGEHSQETSANWRGGTTPQNKLERARFKTEMQKKVFDRDNYTCQICKVRGGDLQVDHIQRWSKYIEGRFDINNCRTLCAKCHYEITFGRPMSEDTSGWGHNLLGGNLQ